MSQPLHYLSAYFEANTPTLSRRRAQGGLQEAMERAMALEGEGAEPA